MPNKLSTFIKKTLLRKKNNLVSLENHYEVMRRLLKGHKVTAVIDAGASTGRISKKLLKKFPHANAYAFEPNPYFRNILQQYAKQDPRFHPNFAAVSDFDGTAQLHITQSRGNVSLFAPAERLGAVSIGSAVTDIIKTDVVTIDQWTRRNGDIPVQLIKFDVEGAEPKAIAGAARVLQSSVLLVYTEIWFCPVYQGGALFGEVDACLRQNGFDLFDIYKPHYDNRGRLARANAIYTHSKRLPV